MRFTKKYPASLKELLLAPLVLREGQPWLRDLPPVHPALLHDLAASWGHGAGAVRTALSRLRAAGDIETIEVDGTTRYRLGALGRSITRTVGGRRKRPAGYSLAVFSFSTEDSRERHLVREALRLHGFQKLAQNVYINGVIDTTELTRVFEQSGVSQHVFLFRSSGEPDLERDERLRALFGLPERAKVLTRFADDLEAFLGEEHLSGADFARRYFAAAPAHYRITFTDEPPLPESCLPPGYPLGRLEPFGAPTAQRVRALRRYFESFD